MAESTDERARRELLIAQIAIQVTLGFSLTFLVSNSATAQRDVRLVIKGVGRVIAGPVLQLGKVERIAVRGVSKGIKAAGRAAVLGAIETRGVTVKVFKSGKVFSALRFLNVISAVADTGLGIKREREQGGDVAQQIAGGAVGLTLGIVTLGLAPKGVSTLERNEAGSLVLTGSTASFFRKETLTDLVGEAIRLLT